MAIKTYTGGVKLIEEEIPTLKPLKKIEGEQMFTPTIYSGGVKQIEEITEHGLYKWEIAPEVEETWWDKFKKVFEAKPIEEIAKSQNIYAISQATDKSIEEVSRDYDKMGRALGLRGIPTSEEYMAGMFAFPVAAAIMAHPITALMGIGKFMALSEAENFAISKIKGWKYKFDAGVGLRELLPSETNQLTKDIIDVIDVIGKGVIVGKADKNVREMWNRFTKQISVEYRMPQKMYLSSKKIMDLHKSNPELYTQFEKDIYAKLGGKAEAVKMAFKKGGVDLEIPASKITTITDRPYWAKIKNLFNVKATSKTVVDLAGNIKPTIETLLLPGEVKEGIPVVTQPQIILEKAAGLLSIEAPFNRMGAKETGFQVKNYYSNVGLARGQGLQEIDILNKFKIAPVTAKESGFKVSGELDYTDITYLTERPGYFVRLTPEERKKVSPIKKSVKEFYKVWEDRFKKIEWMEEPFPKSLITRNQGKISGLKKQLKVTKIELEKQKIRVEVDKLTKQIERVKKQKIQFVSIPAKAILAKADTDPEMQTKLMSILPHWGRTTITVKDLVDANIISRQEADIRYIIGEYSDRMGRKYALGKIFETAEKEGLIKPEAIKPNWATPRIYIKGQYAEIPQLRGKRLDPFFSDVVTNFFSAGPVTMGPVFGTIKMMQFYNPLFMPMYDVWQAAAIGVFLNPIKGAEYFYRGIKDVLLKTDNYWLAYENGTMSKPYTIPYNKFEYKFKEAMEGNKLGNFVKKAVLPVNWLPMLYTTSWNTAWTLDPMVRMMSFNYLLDKGMSPRNAGQLAALFHSDYASVPPATRRTLNKILFTPTFKITMSKLYAEMFKGSAKILTKGKNATQREKILARGALIALGIMMGLKLYLENQGYEEIERFRKYTKTVETDEGMKENVITLSHPFNIPWRYYYRVKNAWKPQNLNVAEKLVEAAKWDLHPIWRVAYDVVKNDNFSIYNPFDESDKIALDLGMYVTGEFVAITRGLLESAETGEISAENFRVLQKDMGKLKAIILKPFIFHYVRERRGVRKIWAVKRLQKEFTSMLYTEASKDSKINHIWIENFNERLKKILEMFKEEKEKEYSGGVKRLR